MLKIEFTDIADKENIIAEHSELILIEEQQLFEGNFLILGTEEEKQQINVVYAQVPKFEFEDIKSTNEELTNYMLDVDMRLVIVELGLQ